jgi:N-succinyldiaminopimelate aminotransferase
MTFAGGTPFQHAAAAVLGSAEEHGAQLAAALKAKRDRLCDGPERAGVVAIPTSVFSGDPDRIRSLVRFAFCKREEVIDEAAARLGQLS